MIDIRNMVAKTYEQDRRDELARILEIVARDGLNGPRDLDVACEAIEALFAE